MNVTDIKLELEEQLLLKIKSIPADQIIIPTIPIAIYLQEAENLAVWAFDDLDSLSKVGISSAHIEDLKDRIEVCRTFQTEWLKLKKIKPKEQKLWEDTRQQAIEMRGGLIPIYRYAFRNDNPALKDLKSINKKNRTAELVSTLINLCRIGNTYSELLEKISFDFNQLETTKELAYKLQDQRSVYVAITPERDKIKSLRDQSYTYLKHLLDEIKNAGKFVFADNKERLQGYHFMYYKAKKALVKEKDSSI